MFEDEVHMIIPTASSEQKKHTERYGEESGTQI